MQVGVQLYSYSKGFDLGQTWSEVLGHIREAGYDAVEFANDDLGALKARLDALGLGHVGTHTGMRDLENLDHFRRVADALGGRHVCVSGLLDWSSRAADDYHRGVEVLNDAGAKLRADGIHVHYHNHDFEFEPLNEGGRGIDLLLAGLDPNAADLCVDFGWVHFAGVDPVAFARDQRARIGYAHLKDFRGKEACALGTGDVDLAGVMAQLSREIPWVVETEPTADPIPVMRDSLAFVRGWLATNPA